MHTKTVPKLLLLDGHVRAVLPHLVGLFAVPTPRDQIVSGLDVWHPHPIDDVGGHHRVVGRATSARRVAHLLAICFMRCCYRQSAAGPVPGALAMSGCSQQDAQSAALS